MRKSVVYYEYSVRDIAQPGLARLTGGQKVRSSNLRIPTIFFALIPRQKKWSGYGDSNSGPFDPQSNALNQAALYPDSMLHNIHAFRAFSSRKSSFLQKYPFFLREMNFMPGILDNWIPVPDRRSAFFGKPHGCRRRAPQRFCPG